MLHTQRHNNGMLTVLEVLQKKYPRRLYSTKDDYKDIMYQEGYQQCLKDIEELILKETKR